MKSLIAIFCLTSLSLLAFSQRQSTDTLPADYQSLGAETKQALLWENIVNTEWTRLPELSGKGWGGLLDTLKAAGSLATTFNHVSDELPMGRKKILHPYGVVAKFSFKVNKSSSYTGIFKSGGIGLTRFSLAGNPQSVGFTPGVAFKFLIDGRPSKNMFVMHSLNGQDSDTNWFKHTFSNKLPAPKGFILKAISAFFSFTHKTPNFLTLDHLAEFDRKGVKAAGKSPKQIFLVPSDDVKNIISSTSMKDFREDLYSLSAGTELYRVYVSGKDDLSDFILLGSMILETEMIGSEYADKKLFFQHHH